MNNFEKLKRSNFSLPLIFWTPNFQSMSKTLLFKQERCTVLQAIRALDSIRPGAKYFLNSAGAVREGAHLGPPIKLVPPQKFHFLLFTIMGKCFYLQI